ncbi:hypothetical protein C8R47DRAFT_1229274 [Mycena vitilis]|nr:hypothetical protein C8R47DRAFT_1229274 [Mycena vitilis]
MPANPLMSVANKPLPLTTDFPFSAWRTPPPDLAIPDDMDIAERNTYNDRVDKFNVKSIEVTRAYEAVLQAGGTPATTSDIGPPLRAPYACTNDEMDLMVDSESFCQVAAPIPASLMRIIIVMRVDRFKEAEKKKEREKAAKESGLDLVGKLVMCNPHRTEPLTRPDAVLPTVFLHALSSRLHPPLFHPCLYPHMYAALLGGYIYMWARLKRAPIERNIYMWGDIHIRRISFIQ